MGGSGTGKSTFINLISGDRLRVGETLESCTEDVALSLPFSIDGQRIRLVDTPGFDDTSKSDAEILSVIVQFLAEEYKNGRRLHGVIFLHRISDVRMGGVSRRNFTICQKLCGVDFFHNVVIATTRWDEVDLRTGEAREREFRAKPDLFKPLLDAGAKLMRHCDFDSAQEILRTFLKVGPLPLLVQIELVDRGLDMADTEAGLELRRHVMKQNQRAEKEMNDLLDELKEAALANDTAGQKILEQECEELRQKMSLLHSEAKKLSRDPEPAGTPFVQVGGVGAVITTVGGGGEREEIGKKIEELEGRFLEALNHCEDSNRAQVTALQHDLDRLKEQRLTGSPNQMPVNQSWYSLGKEMMNFAVDTISVSLSRFIRPR
ncbi:hypothetical protein GALMADRAFT_257785 [Galerina marginata CBS 339.88]|uniref:G domain-containing protein n=1 Tax=Galerina marginata (strain CBS 339.88) TaxID=685588 RepID=A0A067SAG1_GALM3|nr:hypothetical protein GALMADRAFT_257785 [Galerina marginata CBS 339.88]